jgi:hypothetical protein
MLDPLDDLFDVKATAWQVFIIILQILQIFYIFF